RAYISIAEPHPTLPWLASDGRSPTAGFSPDHLFQSARAESRCPECELSEREPDIVVQPYAVTDPGSRLARRERAAGPQFWARPLESRQARRPERRRSVRRRLRPEHRRLPRPEGVLPKLVPRPLSSSPSSECV